MEIKTPFIRHRVRSGDAIEAMTTALGITPCAGCKGRRDVANKLVFVPRAKGIILPDGFRPAKVESRADGAQVILGLSKRQWATWEKRGDAVEQMHVWKTQSEAVADFKIRLGDGA
jgi:hypothetical protein